MTILQEFCLGAEDAELTALIKEMDNRKAIDELLKEMESAKIKEIIDDILASAT